VEKSLGITLMTMLDAVIERVAKDLGLDKKILLAE
jgi:hypothetical protein